MKIHSAKDSQEMAFGDQVAFYLGRTSSRASPRRLQAATLKCVNDQQRNGVLGRRQTPRLIDQIRERNLAATRSRTSSARNHAQAVSEEDRFLQVLGMLVCRRPHDRELYVASAQFALLQRLGVRLHDFEGEAWILSGEAIDKSREQSCGHELDRADPQFAGRPIREDLDLADACAQIIEDGDTPLEQCATVKRRVDAFRPAIKETNAERIFKVGDRFRYDRLCNRKTLGCLRHAAALDDSGQHAELSQLEAAADLLDTIHHSTHSKKL